MKRSQMKCNIFICDVHHQGEKDRASEMKEEFMMCGGLPYSPWPLTLLAGAK